MCIRDSVYCFQTDGWIKMSLGPKVGLRPGHIALDGDSAPSSPPQKRGHRPPIFGPCLFLPNGRPFQLLLSTCFIYFADHVQEIVEGNCTETAVGHQVSVNMYSLHESLIMTSVKSACHSLIFCCYCEPLHLPHIFYCRPMK